MSSEPFRLRLYVLGGHVGSARAEPDLRAVLEATVPGRYELEIVDLRARPDLALADHVLAAPTVIRLAPLPERRAIGSLSDAKAVADALGLTKDSGA